MVEGRGWECDPGTEREGRERPEHTSDSERRQHSGAQVNRHRHGVQRAAGGVCCVTVAGQGVAPACRSVVGAVSVACPPRLLGPRFWH